MSSASLLSPRCSPDWFSSRQGAGGGVTQNLGCRGAATRGGSWTTAAGGAGAPEAEGPAGMPPSLVSGRGRSVLGGSPPLGVRGSASGHDLSHDRCVEPQQLLIRESRDVGVGHAVPRIHDRNVVVLTGSTAAVPASRSWCRRTATSSWEVTLTSAGTPAATSLGGTGNAQVEVLGLIVRWRRGSRWFPRRTAAATRAARASGGTAIAGVVRAAVNTSTA